MNTDYKIIESYIEKAVDEASNGNTDYFFTLESKVNPDYWVQFTYDLINLGYPFKEDPKEKFKELGLEKNIEGLDIIDWKADTFVTLEFDAENLDIPIKFVAEYLFKVFELKLNLDEFNYSEE